MILAIDCDLRKSYGVTDNGVATDGPTPVEVINTIGKQRPIDTILFEIASPVSFNRGPEGAAATHQLAKWAIWNVAWAAAIAQELKLGQSTTQMLVAPSNVWTKGHTRAARHLIAGCTAKNKDLRECEAMIYFYKKEPQLWVPLSSYLSQL